MLLAGIISSLFCGKYETSNDIRITKATNSRVNTSIPRLRTRIRENEALAKRRQRLKIEI